MVKRKVPLRKCLGCNEMKNKKELIRIVKTPEDEFIVDFTGKKNGRGAYFCPEEECLKKLIKNKGLEKSFKTKIPEEVYNQLKEEFNSFEK
ncbi:hypothetical protein EDC19_0339 [Natranaerovirga hydrolytica]|uniref:YlxR domain-containing protein n=1 Tax=Natranaerovirga hydrolytica TaxID=680378 RepID=A0A4R1MXF3_9FIRM|nr:YlxR family protein [Natranaerovirga hydrolytica]TCK97937.1 hypothetical protein EDC19_0339 [Natranaerovirga hydrolytica]